jgi:hypothetical protein
MSGNSRQMVLKHSASRLVAAGGLIPSRKRPVSPRAALSFTVIDAGELKTARLLEPYGMLWIHLALTQKVPGDFAFALLAK